MNKRSLPFLFLLCAFSIVRAQQFDSLLKVLDSRFPQEKLYLHFDRSYYNPGETIWFKAYIFSANIPSQISTTLYAELYDEKGTLLERRNAPVVMSSAAIGFDLSPTLSSSTVYIRAYTDWMLNFDSSFLYNKAIPVLQEKLPVKSIAVPKSFLQFFPEGGDLVAGSESRVAFKATDVRGMPYSAMGNIVDGKGKAVARFESMHDGMGFFTLTPEPKENYKAVWKDAAGKMQQTILPVVKKEGMVLQLLQDTGGIKFSVTRTEAEVPASSFVYVVAQMQQQMVYMATANISKSRTIRGNIPTVNIPAGIVQVTVFSEDHKPLAERIVFVNKQDYYFITDLNSPLKSFEKRKKNVIQIDVPDTISSNLSVAITDAGVNPALPGEEDIFSGVLLTSDIKGYVHNPGYYFSSEADSVVQHLDLVMMTNGWRRFKWDDVLAGKFPKTDHRPGDYLTLTGKVNGLTKAQLSKQELTGILEINKQQQFVNLPVDPVTGTFTIPGMIFFDTAKLFYQFNNDKDRVMTSRAVIDIKNSFLKTNIPYRADTSLAKRTTLPGQDALDQSKNIAEKNIALMDARRKVQVLESVTVTANKKSKADLMDEQYASGLFRGSDGYTFIMEDDVFANGAISVLNYLQGKVAGLQITGNGEAMTMSWRGGTPALFLNEMQSEVSIIQSTPMSNVAMIKVMRPPFFGATGGGSGGAIAVYTKKGAPTNQNFKGLDFAKIPGYSPTKEFYSPDYSKYNEKNSEADYRPTLYWNPFVMTDKNSRRVLFTFYNNDITRKFRIVIEGCNAEGKLTRMEKIFQ